MARHAALILSLLIALAGCTSPAPDAAAPASGGGAPTAAAAADGAATTPAARPGGGGEGPRGEYDRELVNFRGFGPARFGADEEAVRQAWGRPLQPQSLAGTEHCYYLEMDPRPPRGTGLSAAFMFEGAVFVRYDVFGTTPVAPGGFVVGSRAEDILAEFGSRVEERAHPYFEGGRYLVVSPEFGEAARLVFEIDAEGRVRQWRIGLPPQVFYGEGCA